MFQEDHCKFILELFFINENLFKISLSFLKKETLTFMNRILELNKFLFSLHSFHFFEQNVCYFEMLSLVGFYD